MCAVTRPLAPEAGGKAWPLVTVGIPTRDRARTYLRETLSSAVTQTYSRIEIVVSDNCSVDETEAVVGEVTDPRVRYFRHREDIGANGNFNFCLGQARGDYFLLLHDDDRIDHDFVESCMRAADYRTDLGIIRTGTRIIDAQGIVLRELPNGVVGVPTEAFFRGWFAGRTTLYLCSTLFNTKRLREAGGFASPHHVFQDAFAMIRLAAVFGRADVNEVKASFRRHPAGRTFSTRVGDWCEDSLALLDLMCDLATDDKEAVRTEGLRFFAGLNYGRAAEARSPLRRLAGYGVVCRKFNYRYAPSRSALYRLLDGTALFSVARYAKRKVKQQFSVG